MRPIELVEWRRKFAVSQAQLAEMLGKSRKTVVNWERGHTRMPKAFESTLSDLVPYLTRTSEKPAETPDFVSPRAAPLRPNLRLYGNPAKRGAFEIGPEHPRALFAGDMHLLHRIYPGLLENGELQRIPWAFLDHPLFLDRLAQHRANRQSASVDENATPEQIAAAGLAKHLARLTSAEREEYAYCKRHGIPWKHWQENVPAEQRRRLLEFDANKKDDL
jgi:transcriptional regulator with XRE-family HTH domain